jgi:hypothetical protein
MIRYARLAAGAATCIAVVIYLAVDSRADDKEDAAKEVAAAKEAVLKWVDKPGTADDAKALAKKHTTERVMHLFKPRDKNGIGVGAKPYGAPIKDSIELTIIDLAKDDKKLPTKDIVSKLGPDIVTLAKQTQAIAEINAYQAPAPMGAKQPALWKQLNDDMKAGAADMIAKSTDPVAVKAAAMKINNACVKCHETFRTDN